MPVARFAGGEFSGIVVLRVALLSFLLMSAILLGGAGIYTTGAMGNHLPSDGYGVSTLSHPDK